MACPHVAGAVALFLSDGVAPMLVEDYLKSWTGFGHITDAKSNNMLLRIPDCVGAGSDCTAPPHPPTTTTTTTALPPGQRLVWSVTEGTGCTVDAQGCASSLNYPQAYGNNERCTITISVPGAIHVEGFNTETGYDKLRISGTDYDGTGPPEGLIASPYGSVSQEDVLWRSDGSVTGTGWRLCPQVQGPPAPAPGPAGGPAGAGIHTTPIIINTPAPTWFPPTTTLPFFLTTTQYNPYATTTGAYGAFGTTTGAYGVTTTRPAYR